jgi:methylated-DNA-protein-cysteine methyltransferase-like protein
MWSPPNPKQYNARVWFIVRHIPAGQVVSYGQLAAALPVPDGDDADQYRRLGARWVGAALRNVGPQLPWWRVINSRGGISLPAGSAPALEQRHRLEQEGVPFNAAGLVDLQVYGWHTLDDWLNEQTLP